ncbi:hypothetical protein FCN80_04605 [Martelella alba]|uniref:Uncharacterized protein n=1 Tax=Martelella alba TaxID=2590451 RepID=A0ABY2SNY4_9HYPH|nr:hypothetical protein [Martelella alba]TKI07731.1 hypothetical protein FCN80_04605 [Martelella alba]
MLRQGEIAPAVLARVQRRRQFATWATQSLQRLLTGRSDRTGKPPRAPSTLERWLRRRRWVPHVAGRIIGVGFRSETPRSSFHPRHRG